LGTERLSPFSDAGRDADARAFAALMRRLRLIDGDEHTVILVQVENEVGMIPDARDHSPAAAAAFAGPVPRDLIDHLQRNKEDLNADLLSRWRAGGETLARTRLGLERTAAGEMPHINHFAIRVAGFNRQAVTRKLGSIGVTVLPSTDEQLLRFRDLDGIAVELRPSA
jgi:hypothetical protein